ncbi:hypothetical protein SMC26_31755 [Actinomadura fulvescens]|uniref:Uncharacterized protein n=1 Tax=Actinomadura fulvescens TaxID=46160 RepID=A0ABN3Q8Z2_9ACTN
MFEKHSPRYPLSIEQGTENTPDDDQFHVIVEGEIVLSTRVLDLAKIIYEEQREELRIKAGHPDPREILRSENAGRDVRSLRSEGIAGQSRRKNRGGPGGRGGV